MTRLFQSKSWEFVGRTEFSPSPPSPFLCNFKKNEEEGEDQLVGVGDDDDSRKPISEAGLTANNNNNRSHFAILDAVVEALKKSLVTCSLEKEDNSPMDISWPTEVHHVFHVTFDRLNGFLGLPSDLEPELSRSSSAKVFGISAESMECSYDDRGNLCPDNSTVNTKVEGIFRINAENSQEEYVCDQLKNGGVVPHGCDVHCLSALIKAWFRELPTRVLDCVTPEKLVNCNTEEGCTNLVKLLPPTEAALLHWAIILMADVVHHQEFNRMNAQNIAMVFAANMTQIVDPLNALTHAGQIVNFLKTLILKVLRERGKSNAEATPLSPCSDSPPYSGTDRLSVNSNSDEEACGKNEGSSAAKPSLKYNFSRTSTLGRMEWRNKEKLWSSGESECVIDDREPSRHEIVCLEYRDRRYEGGH